MSARTTTIRRAIAQAGDAGLAHIALQRDTGTWVSICGRQVRGQDLRITEGPTAGTHAEHLGSAFCDACRDIAVPILGALADGVAVLLRVAPTAAGVQLLEVPLSAVHIDPARSARTADAGLVHSVAAHGVLQPIVVRRTPAGLVLVAGGRRLAAAALADQATVPVLVHDLTPEDAAVATLAENLHRADLDPIAQARAYQHALEVLAVTQEALADRVGVSRVHVSNTIRLLGLPPEIRQHITSGALSAAHGRELLRMAKPTEQATLAAQVLAETLTVRQTAARRAAGSPDERLGDVARLLAGVLGARVQVTAGVERARITIDLDGAELPRVLEQLGVAGVSR